MPSDLLIIGAGLAGLMAGIHAAQQGLRPRIIATGFGATHWTAGTIDVLGYLPGDPKPVHHPFQAVPQLLAQRPQHPYGLVGVPALRRALQHFQELTTTLGLPYGGGRNPHTNLLLPSPLGAPRPTFLAPVAQRAGDMTREEPYLIVGFRGMRDFYPTLMAENLTRQGHQARAIFLPLDLITPQQDNTPLHLARALDREAVAMRLAQALKSHIQPGERVGLPAILGLERHQQVWGLMQEILAAPIFEIPTLPPSVPGIRLTRALRRHLERDLQVPVDLGMTVMDFHAQAARVQWVRTRASARPLKHRAQAFLLATGGFLGGGFTSDTRGRAWETVFHLPLTIPQDRGQWFRPDFLAAEGHPIFWGGLRADAEMRPVDATGRVVYENVRLAGDLFTDSDPLAERSLEGVALATAWVAVHGLKFA